MNLIQKFTIAFIICWCLASIDSASVNVTISNQTIHIGATLRLTATTDPKFGDDSLETISCGYSESDGTGYTELAYYKRRERKMEITTSALVPASVKQRLSMTSTFDPMELDISSITFADEKRLFYCEMVYYNASTEIRVLSEKHQLLTVYSSHILNETQSMQSSTSMTDGVAENLTCVVTGRPASTITWQYDSMINAINTTTYDGSPLITVTSVLTVQNPTRYMDGQQIKCVISNEFSSTIIRTTTLSIDYRPVNTQFHVHPENPKLNQVINLNCSATGKPAVTMYKFHVDGVLIGSSVNGSLSISADNCSKYNGNFTCTPENEKGQGEIGHKLVVVRDDVTTSVASSSLVFNETQNATLQCNVSGCPLPSISWRRDGQVLVNESKSSLMLNSLQRSDAGQYSCFADNNYANSSSSIQVTVNYKPVSTQLSANATKPVVNSSVTLNCTSDALPKAEYQFYRIDSTGQTEVSSSNSGKTGIMLISAIALPLTGYDVTYRCVPRNALGSGVEQNLTINIQDPAKISQFVIDPNTVNETKPVSIQCNAVGNPLPNVTITGPNNATLSQNGTHTLSSVSRNDAGQYTCTANNGIGSPASTAADLIVYYVPEILSMNSAPSKVYTGSNVLVSCTARGNPTPNYKFYNESGALLQDNSSNVYEMTLKYEDYSGYQALFKCVPYNSLGEGGARNLSVEILVRPKVSMSISPHTVNETQNTTISCLVSAANPPANITLNGPRSQTIELTNGSATLTNLTRNDAGSYSCIASNGLIGTPIIVYTSLNVNHEPDQVQLTASSLKPTTGSSVTLNCTARASPPASFKFILINGSSTKTLQDNTTNHYTIPAIDYRQYTNYLAKYQCIAYNSFGESPQQNISLDIQVPPSISFSIKPSNVSETQNATAECIVNAANPTPNITIVDNKKRSINHFGGRATIAHIMRDQAGVYTCTADNGIGGIISKQSSLAVSHAPDQVELKVSSYSPIDGTSFTLNCSARATPLPNRYKFINIKGSSESTLQDTSFPTYTIAAIDYNNYDNYKAMFACIPFNSIGSGPSKNVTVDIQVSPKVSTLPAITVTEGENIALHCNITAANPSASVIWLSPSNSPISTTDGKILLLSINRNQDGVYSCQASNSIGNTTKTTTVTVNYLPKILQNYTELTRCIGESVEIMCNAVGVPSPDVALYFNGARLSKSANGLNHSIQVNTAEKFGNYICKSNNTVGEVNVTTRVKAKASGSVENVKITPKDDSIEITWSLPLCSANIKGITVQYRKVGETTWRQEVKAPNPLDTKLVITGLENDVSYEVRLVVVDVNNVSHMSQPLTTAVSGKSDTTNNGPLIGGIIGGAVFLFILVLVCYLFAKKRRQSSSANDEIGYSNETLKQEKSKDIEMAGVDTGHYKAPDGSVYASVKGKSGNVNGAIDNANFVADSDGAYEAVQGEPEKKKEEGNYASLGSFQSPNNNDKPKEKPKTEYATLEELGPLKDYAEPQKEEEGESNTHKITVEPESTETPGEIAPAADTATSEPAADTAATSEPAADTAATSEPAADTTVTVSPSADTPNDGGLSGNVDMI